MILIVIVVLLIANFILNLRNFFILQIIRRDVNEQYREMRRIDDEEELYNQVREV